MEPAPLIITLLTAGACGLLYFVLSLRVVLVRRTAGVSLGDGGDAELLARIRAHANFAEYVPFCLLLIGAIELSTDIAPLGLWIAGAGLIIVRLFHAVGMALPAPNPWRVLGTAGTWTLMVLLSLWGMVIAVFG